MTPKTCQNCKHFRPTTSECRFPDNPIFAEDAKEYVKTNGCVPNVFGVYKTFTCPSFLSHGKYSKRSFLNIPE